MQKNSYIIKYGFNSKSSSKQIRRALNIALDLGYEEDLYDENVYVIKSNELNDELIELIKLTQNLAKSYLYVNGKEVFDIYDFIEIANCNQFNICKGNCHLIDNYIYWNSALKKMGIQIGDDDDWFQFFDLDLSFIQNKNLFIKETKTEIVISKNVFKEEYLKAIENVKNYCCKLNYKKIIRQIDCKGKNIHIKKYNTEFLENTENQCEIFEHNNNPFRNKNSIIELNAMIEKIEATEKKLGVTISGINCYSEVNEYDGIVEYEITCNGEILGEEVEVNFSVKCTAFDENGRVLGEGSKNFYSDSFSGYDTFQIYVNTKNRPTKIKIFVLKN